MYAHLESEHDAKQQQVKVQVEQNIERFVRAHSAYATTRMHINSVCCLASSKDRMSSEQVADLESRLDKLVEAMTAQSEKSRGDQEESASERRALREHIDRDQKLQAAQQKEIEKWRRRADDMQASIRYCNVIVHVLNALCTLPRFELAGTFLTLCHALRACRYAGTR